MHTSKIKNIIHR